MYLHTILTRSNTELIKRVYNAQKEKPTKGDFYNLVKNDFLEIEEDMNEEKIASTTKHTFKRNIKMKIKIAATRYLKEKQNKHSKVKSIKYDKLKTQKYMKSPLFTNDEVNLLLAIRSRFLDCKMNFKTNMTKTIFSAVFVMKRRIHKNTC